MNIKEIKEMLQLMAEHQLCEIEIEKDGLKIKLKKGVNTKALQEDSAIPSAPIPVPRLLETPATAPTGPSQPVLDNPNIFIVKSPMVGTFYAAPAPDQPVYAAPGQRIKEGDVLCIVEAMKLMNEIKAEVSGQILEIFAKNGQPVEFDQLLFKIQKG